MSLPRLDDKFDSFNKYRNSQLELDCEEGDFGLLEFTPNASWPDVVYYQVLFLLFFNIQKKCFLHISALQKVSKNTYRILCRTIKYLKMKCQGNLPLSSWPPFSQSYTHPYMGWRINVVDSFNQRFIHRATTAGAGGEKARASWNAALLSAALILILLSSV